MHLVGIVFSILAALNVLVSPWAATVSPATKLGKVIHAFAALSPLDVAKAWNILRGALVLPVLALMFVAGGCTPGERATVRTDVGVAAVDLSKGATQVELDCRAAVFARLPTADTLTVVKACAILDPAAAATLALTAAVMKWEDAGSQAAVVPALNAVVAAQQVAAAVKDAGVP